MVSAELPVATIAFLFAAALGDALVMRAEEAVGPCRGGADVAHGSGDPPAVVLFFRSADWCPWGQDLAQDTRYGGGEAAHVDAELGDQLLCGGDADTGYLIELLTQPCVRPGREGWPGSRRRRDGRLRLRSATWPRGAWSR